VPIRFDPEGYPDESDNGPFPIPRDAPVEGGSNSDGDRHVLVVEQGSCTLVELYNAWPERDDSWKVQASTEVLAHALRFTAPRTRRAYLWPARHFASDEDDPTLPPMGQRFRLKADVDVSSFSRDNQVILTALKTYGMILADNGSAWFLSGAPHAGWDEEDLHELGRITGADFEAVDQFGLMRNPDSG
jgi:hypothetical protein